MRNKLYKITVLATKNGYDVNVDEFAYYIDDKNNIFYMNNGKEQESHSSRLNELFTPYVNILKPKLELFTFDKRRINHYVDYMKTYIKSELINMSVRIDDLLNTLN